LAVSDDLVKWEPLGAILPRGENGAWDQCQAAGGPALCDTTWGGGSSLERFGGSYWMSYLGGALPGYETPPLSTSLAHTHHPDKPEAWSRIGKPTLTPGDADARPFERRTIYKTQIVRDPASRLGCPFVMFYNASDEACVERIGMAVSDDMLNWRRFGDAPVIDNGSGISGDPQLVRIGDLWVMFYFGAFWRPNAFDTFACSSDLVNWTKWDGPDLVAPSEPWDREFAHKPWVLEHDGIVYHFYCAVGDQGRTIALATSEPVA
jgi:predicted GH43/DUF377 family glycosyl hydrolase